MDVLLAIIIAIVIVLLVGLFAVGFLISFCSRKDEEMWRIYFKEKDKNK